MGEDAWITILRATLKEQRVKHIVATPEGVCVSYEDGSEHQSGPFMKEPSYHAIPGKRFDE